MPQHTANKFHGRLRDNHVYGLNVQKTHTTNELFSTFISLTLY